MLVTIIGKRGRGKTTLVKKLIRESDADRVLILDFLGEYSSRNDERVIISRKYLYPFCKNAWESSHKSFKTLLIFDEIDCYSKYDFCIEFLYKYSRHCSIDMIAVSRGFYDLQVMTRKLTDMFYLFQMTDIRDIDYLRRFRDKEYIHKVMNLDYYEYMKLEL